MAVRMKKKRGIAGFLCLSLLLVGCGGAAPQKEDGKEQEIQASVSCLEVKKDGSLTETIAEDFSREYYNAEELKSYIMSEVARHNESGEKDSISIDRFEEKDGFIYVTMTYPSSDSFVSYNSSGYKDVPFFCGTVAEAYDAGMDLEVTLTNVKNEEKTLGREELLGMGEEHILICGEPMTVKLYKKITHTGGDVTVTGKNEAELLRNGGAETQELCYILF